jgi:FSR family fosmidomycin resistance protein-like MFS transporter
MKDNVEAGSTVNLTVGESTIAPDALPSTADAAGASRRNLILGVVNLSHVFNHMQSGMVSILYPVMMGELGFGYFQIGVLQTIYQLSAMGFQVVYGVLARFFPRAILLGIGNMICGAFYMATGLTQNFAQVGAMRGFSGLGSSVQHPVGSAILVSYFEKARGGVLTLHHSAGNLGGFLAPAVAGALLLFVDWRTVFYIVGIPGVVMGLFYFFLRDTVVAAGEVGEKKSRIRGSLQDYLQCLKNRNVVMISLIQMVGAAGRGTGVNVAFLTAFFIARLKVSVTAAAGLLMVYQLSGLLGPLAIGWLSDRFNRKAVLQLTLFGSTLTTLWLLVHQTVSPMLILNLICYGALIQSRGTLTQSVISEAVPIHQMDVAFSIYFFIGFISGPAWTFLVGWLIDASSFTLAFQVVSVSYLAGMLLVFFATWRGANPFQKAVP